MNYVALATLHLSANAHDYVQPPKRTASISSSRGLLSNTAKSWQHVFVIDVLAYIVSILSVLATVDQVPIIWVSIIRAAYFLSWGFYAICAFDMVHLRINSQR